MFDYHLILNFLAGFAIGIIPVQYLILKNISITADGLSFKYKLILFCTDFVKGFAGANLLVFFYYNGFAETVVSIFALLLANLIIEVKRKTVFNSPAVILGALLWFNYLFFFAWFVIWILLLIYKRKSFFANTFSALLMMIMVVLYADRFNSNCNPPAESDLIFIISSLVLIILQAGIYYKNFISFFYKETGNE
ncbi:MAG: hypothetical protein GXX85_11910 [Ignavibacteria bacterium]|nr:hypothetical protein [Ignavibacteria bacterium]